MTEDCRRLPKTFEEGTKMFRCCTNEFKYNLRDKLDISEIIVIFTCEDIIFTCEDIVLFLWICCHSVYHWLLCNKNLYLFLWSWAGGILRILQSDCFRERAVFSYLLTTVTVTAGNSAGELSCSATFREWTSGDRRFFSLFTLPWMIINQRKFTSVQFSVARKVTVSRFNLVFCSSECLCCL